MCIIAEKRGIVRCPKNEDIATLLEVHVPLWWQAFVLKHRLYTINHDCLPFIYDANILYIVQ